ncbi:MAG: phosphate acetyltransferase [Christensenellaceae bacterium]|nr:phosphate acetyltransferase [Christensenellaceae bacterium]
MSLMNQIKNKARQQKRRIVLPEGSEPRTLQAAEILLKEGICELILLGDEEAIKGSGAKLDGATIIDPRTSGKLEEYAQELYELRKSKGMTQEAALEQMKDETFFGTMMMKKNEADGMVSGAVHSTADTLRPALQIIKTQKGVTTASSCFVMEMKDASFGQNGVMIFADCAVNIDPNAEQLAAIAIASAETAKAIAEIETPKVAMLSFSTKGSGKGEMVDKVRAATELIKQLAPELEVDGELQADAALVESVGQLKSPGSKVAGQANVLVFPDLQAGNIGYKLVQRLAGAEAIGPVMQGLARPVNDLSRGCSVEDIVSLCALTAVQAQ